MGRRVAIVGALLAAAGVVLSVWWWAPDMVQPVSPLAAAVRAVLGLFPLLGTNLLVAGAVMLALALVTAVSGRRPVHSLPTGLLWAGIGLWVVNAVGEITLLRSLGAGTTLLGTAVFPVVALLGLTGSALVALWLTAAVTTGGVPQVPGRGAERTLRS